MTTSPDPYRYFRYPAEVIKHALWLYHLFRLYLWDVKLILAAREVVVSDETVREWGLRFGRLFANELKRRRPRPGDTRYVDEVFIRIRGKLHSLWRAVDQHGHVLDVLLANPGVKRPHVDRRRGRVRSRLGTDHPGSPFQELVFLGRDLVRVRIKLLGQFGQRLLAPYGSQRHFRLESRRTVPPRSIAHRLSCAAAILAAVRQELHSSNLSRFLRSPLKLRNRAFGDHNFVLFSIFQWIGETFSGKEVVKGRARH